MLDIAGITNGILLKVIKPTCIYEWLDRQAQTNPDAIVITTLGRAAFTYHQLRNQANDIVAHLHSNGLGRHNRVAIAEAVTFAAPHTLLGEDVAASVVLQQGEYATEQQIKDFAVA